MNSMTLTSNGRIAFIAAIVVVADQLTKLVVAKTLDLTEQKIIIDGFFKFVHWGNTGAALSIFRGNNLLLAAVSILALIVLALSRHHFDSGTLTGGIALGMIFGGTVGNLIDRIRIGHVVDFLYFHIYRRGGGELGFPAFNVADSAICTGVGLLFLLAWRQDSKPRPLPEGPDAENPAS